MERLDAMLAEKSPAFRRLFTKVINKHLAYPRKTEVEAVLLAEIRQEVEKAVQEDAESSQAEAATL